MSLALWLASMLIFSVDGQIPKSPSTLVHHYRACKRFLGVQVDPWLKPWFQVPTAFSLPRQGGSMPYVEFPHYSMAKYLALLPPSCKSGSLVSCSKILNSKKFSLKQQNLLLVSDYYYKSIFFQKFLIDSGGFYC